MDEIVPYRRSRRGLWIALALTVSAVPLLIIDNRSRDEQPTGPPTTIGRVPIVEVPLADRPASGPPKGVSVVTSSTTTSTMPIILTTTTTQPLPEPVRESDQQPVGTAGAGTG